MMPQELAQLLLNLVKEDAPLGDVTTEAIIGNVEVKAVVLAKEDGYACCLPDFAEALRILGLNANALKRDGGYFNPGESLMMISGNARVILTIERSLLNVLSIILGVVKTTREVVETAHRVNPRVKVAATRKTIPCLRSLIKKAVTVGGADTHRLSLSDAVLIKDNHLAIIGDVEKAVKEARDKATFMHKIEVEVNNIDDAVKAIKAGADAVLIDNVTPIQLRQIISTLESLGLREKAVIEVSGGITPSNITEYAEANPDIISTSYITMKAKPVDISLEITQTTKP
ncbi:carboxylating nicotinate-nucleotide diphosphorylase [Caldivirga maquilingensis]|uniref:Nicotinate-nucleotide pyrophosphorylase [carboxylating] n=1 Tax=Caldivirga maquilingensis (strain ATCC 700844 / DSM 13496 / JCM 10307 / IC-167) TaxID=397948 RepID=A8MAN7_CALMQ|nr:carboxylating nicotinate-nucleotide diphosphorylase [Caldivirga maquilingensis]ABW01073.1 nicotinate-nucleotide pyrophosphorylase [Caldivirga maquilingensis IC-167]